MDEEEFGEYLAALLRKDGVAIGYASVDEGGCVEMITRDNSRFIIEITQAD